MLLFFFALIQIEKLNKKFEWFTLTELNSIISLFELFYDAVDFKIVVHFNAFFKLFLVRFLSCKNSPSPEYSHDLGHFYGLETI